MTELQDIHKNVESIRSTLEQELTHVLGWKSTVALISKQLTEQQRVLNEMQIAVLTSGDTVVRWATVVIAIALIAHVVHHW